MTKKEPHNRPDRETIALVLSDMFGDPSHWDFSKPYKHLQMHPPPGHNVVDYFDSLINRAKNPDQQQAVAWAILETCDHEPKDRHRQKQLRGGLRDYFKAAVDISHANQAAEVLGHLCSAQKNFAYQTAAVVGKGLLATSPWADGYWRMIDIFSDVCACSGQDMLAVKTLTGILVKQKFGDADIEPLHIYKHAKTPETLRVVASAYDARAGQEESCNPRFAEGWRDKAKKTRAHVDRLVQGAAAKKALKPSV